MTAGLILTEVGATEIEAAYQNGQTVTLTVAVFGDGDGAPVTVDPSVTELKGELGEVPFSATSPAEGLIGGMAIIACADYPGSVVREFGLKSDSGTLIAYGAYPDTYLPSQSDSVIKELIVKFVMPLVHAECVELVVDPTLAILTEEEGDRRYLRQALRLGEIADAGTDAQAESREHLGIDALGLGSGPQHKDDAYSNIGQIYRINATSANRPGDSVYGLISLPCDGGPTSSYLALSAGGAIYIGYSAAQADGVAWNRVYTTDYKPVPGDIDAVAKTGDTMTGELKNSAEFQSTGGKNFRIASGTLGTFWLNDGNVLYLMLTNEGDPFGDYNDLRPFSVDLRTGTVAFAHGIHLDGGWPAITTSTGTTWHPDGNVEGSAWEGFLSNWLNTNITNAQNNAQNWAYQNLQQDTQLVGRTAFWNDYTFQCPTGCVLTALGDFGSDDGYGEYSAVQKLINGTWYTLGGN